MDKKEWVVYLVRCADESLYCGVTNDIEKRLIAHNSGKGAKYTKSRIPVEMAGVSSKMTKSEALKFEYRIKRLPTGKKLTELKLEVKNMTIIKELRSISNEIRKISMKVENLSAAIEKIENTKGAKSTATKSLKKKNA
jgi:putative endonuclease